MKEGIAKGQARRLRRICSQDEDYWKYAERTKDKLVSRGYGEVQVKRQLKQGFKMSREEALKRAEKEEDCSTEPFVETLQKECCGSSLV